MNLLFFGKDSMKQTLVVTGGSSGIGRSVAEVFLRKGSRVINLSRRALDLPDVLNYEVDLSRKEGLKDFLKDLDSLFPEKSEICLVHNAYYYVKDSLTSLSAGEVEKSFWVSTLSPMLLNEKLVPKMSEGSSLLFIGSTLSEKAVPGALSYCILKHASVGMMRATVQDLKAFKGIHSLLICPGFTRTPMLEPHLENPETMAMIREKVILERLIEPKEVADLCFYASKSPVLNGTVLHANLGQVES